MSSFALIGGSPLVHARVAGIIGVVMLASGSFAGLVSSKLVVRDDIVATVRNVAASETLFRLGLVGSLAMMIAFLLYAVLLYRLLEPVNRTHALVMLGLVLASVPVYMLNQVHFHAVLLSSADRLYEQAEVFLELYRLGNLIATIFFGLWLFPLGLLVFRSRFLPRILGILLLVGSPGYLVLFVQGFLFPGSERTLWTNPLLVVTHVAELATMLWLLVKGVNAGRWEQLATGSGNPRP